MNRDIEIKAKELDESFEKFDKSLVVISRGEQLLYLLTIIVSVATYFLAEDSVNRILTLCAVIVISLLLQIVLVAYRLASYIIYIIRDNNRATKPLMKLLVSTFRGNLS